MKRLTHLFLGLMISTAALGQEKDSLESNAWSFTADLNLYFIPDDFFVLPLFKADRDWMHLEGRYNYEDRETFSAWFGYNFSGGKKLEYTITPMVGGVVGLTDGVAAGLEFTLALGRFELYSESEYLFDVDANENNFYYNWSDLTYSPTDWLWVGISGQRTRLYQTELDIQRGLILGGGWKNWELTTYLYNIGSDDPFILLTFSATF
jgi:hypothetical protein